MRPPSLLLELSGHGAMGVALGLGYAIALIFFDTFGVRALIAHSDEPRTIMMVFAGMFALTFGVGAALTGFVFIMMEER